MAWANNRTFMKLFFALFGMMVVYVIVSEVHLERECARFCNGDDNRECYLRRSAVLVYDHDVASHEMSFSQNTHPHINIANVATEIATGRYFDIDCPVNHYWPRVSTLRRQSNCAVVGNSGILSGSNCGKVIDAHDYIIRANLAPIRGYEANVGARADMTILNFETLKFLYTNLTTKSRSDHWHRAYVDRVRNLNDSILWYSKSTLQRNSGQYLQEAVGILKDFYRLPIQFAYSWRPVSVEKFYGLKHFATTGFNAYVIATTFCDRVTLYGFYPSQESESGYHVRHHYYEDVSYEYSNPVHNLRSEMRKLRELEAKGEVTIVTDACPGGARKHSRTNQNVNKDAMVDPMFEFRVSDNRLRELFHVDTNFDKKSADADSDSSGRIEADKIKNDTKVDKLQTLNQTVSSNNHGNVGQNVNGVQSNDDVDNARAGGKFLPGYSGKSPDSSRLFSQFISVNNDTATENRRALDIQVDAKGAGRISTGPDKQTRHSFLAADVSFPRTSPKRIADLTLRENAPVRAIPNQNQDDTYITDDDDNDREENEHAIDNDLQFSFLEHELFENAKELPLEEEANN